MAGSNRDTRNQAQRNRAVRQEELRKQLATYGHHTQAVEILEKLADVNGSQAPENVGMEKETIERYKAALNGHLKLIGKYLPDLKATEVSQDPDNPIVNADDAALDARLRAILQSAASSES